MRQTILTIVLIIVLLTIGWVWFRYIKTPSTPELAPPSSIENSEADDERLSQYRRLKNLKPDTGIFSDPLFLGLKSAAGEIPSLEGSPGQPVQTGRNNPFSF